MTELDLDAIEARADAATQGPWYHHDHVVDFGDRPPESPFAVVHAHADHRTPQQAVNAEFIAHARADVPALTAEVRRLRAAVDAALDVADRFESFAQKWRKGSSPDTPIGQRNEIRADVYDAAAERLRAALTAADPTEEDK